MSINRITIALLAASFSCTTAMAQVEEDEFEFDDEEGEELVADVPSDSDTVQVQASMPGDASMPQGLTDEEVSKLLQDWHALNYINYDEDCDPNAPNPTFTDAEYIRRLSRLPNVIEMPYNAVVRQYIDRYSDKLRHTVSLMLGLSNFYTPIFEEALEAYGVPLELKYLPIIESALNPKAVSRAGAVGLWQFIITTGKKYGLEVTSLVDDRCDPVKASFAAAHYLKDLYSMFGDWTLVIASYNCGPSALNKAIQRAGGEKDYWKIYPYLPQETRGYVPAFIAANYIMNYYCDHNICPVNTTLPASTDTIMVSRDLKMEQINELCGVSMEELKALNPQYRTTLIPGAAKPRSLRMSTEAISQFLAVGDSVYNHRASELFSRREAEVAVGETPSRTTSKKRSTSTRAKRVTVRKGDTLGAIARRNGTTVAKLRRLNGIRGNNIRAGQKLRVK